MVYRARIEAPRPRRVYPPLRPSSHRKAAGSRWQLCLKPSVPRGEKGGAGRAVHPIYAKTTQASSLEAVEDLGRKGGRLDRTVRIL